MKHEYSEAKQQCLCIGSFSWLEKPVVQRLTRALRYTVWVQTLAAHSLNMCLGQALYFPGPPFFHSQSKDNHSASHIGFL